MAHLITFVDFDGFILRTNTVRDFIELFYRWGDARFFVRTDERERKFRGQHWFDGNCTHMITLVRKNIERDFQEGRAIGGNLRAPTLETTAGMVLAHELCHANQSLQHKRQERFYTTRRYWDRACEREARLFADEHLEEICSYFAAPFQMTRGSGMMATKGMAAGGAAAVATLLRECPEVTMADVRDELRLAGILNPANVKAVLEELERSGTAVLPEGSER